jgi:hypothetical protein
VLPTQRLPADPAPSRRPAWHAPSNTACLAPMHRHRTGSCACRAHRSASSTSPRAHKGAAPVRRRVGPAPASAPALPQEMPSLQCRRSMRYWTVAATWARPPAVAWIAEAYCCRIHRAEWATAALADPADAPCRQRHFLTRPAAGQSRPWRGLHPTMREAGRSFLRPTPSRGSPDGATTRYGKQTSAAVNTLLSVNHKNLWKTG